MVDVVAGLAAAGRPAVVVPLLLSGGYHVHVDIAGAVAGAGRRRRRPPARARTRGWSRCCTTGWSRPAPIRGDPLTAVVLAAAGSSDPRSVADVENTADLLQRDVGRAGDHRLRLGRPADRCPTPSPPPAGPAPSGSSSPPTCWRPGHFHDKLAGAGADLVTAPLLPDERIAAVLLDRYDAALTR